MEITVKTFTPVCIRSGETLSPLLDFVIEDDKVWFVDKAKLKDIFRDSEVMLRDFTQTTLRESQNIRTFLRDYNIPLEAVTGFSVALCSLNLKDRSRQLYFPVVSSQGAYLPGSSLKGMIRSALLFAYLREKGVAKLEEVFSTGTEGRGRFQGAYTGENIFRNNRKDIFQDALRFVRVSDSSFFPVERLKVYELKRVTKANPIPALVLTIPAKAEFSFTLRIDSQFRRAVFPDFWKEFFQHGEQKILETIRDYSATVLEKEIEILKHLPNYGNLLQFYQKVRPKLRDRVFFRLGFGKTYFFNSVGYFLSRDQLQILFKGNRRVLLNDSFPSTRFVVGGEQEQIPLGWFVVTKPR
ncbi:MAG: type III-A CRISPR-associated RAMP protein Csm5 [Atribacterota bacterium]